MDRNGREIKPGTRKGWRLDFDFLTAFFAFWFGAAFEDLRPVPIRIRPRKR